MLKDLLLNHSGRQRSKMIAIALAMALAAPPGFSQDSGLVAPTGSTANQSKPAFKQEEIDQIVAPIALYPDALLSQIFMASTYPMEIVEAARWAKDYKQLSGDALATELEKQNWDPSVKSLINFPSVLGMMNDKLDWTIKLGDAFLGQQAQVMSTVQSLRSKARAQGNLNSNDQQKVTVEQLTGQPQVIVIQSAQPQVIYVPTYDPTVVYGVWAYPAYPPYYYYPPAYYAAPRTAMWFGAGLTVGLAWGYAWGRCDWRHSSVNVNVNQNININTKINRNAYANQYNRGNANIQGGASNWRHNPAHRDGVAYRDQATANQFNRASSPQATQARDAYRGRVDAGQSNLPRGNGAGQARPSNGYGTGSPDRNYGGTRSGAWDGVYNSGRTAQTDSQRGQSSRSAAGAQHYGGGAGGRGGGGGGGGGGRR